MNAPAPDSLQIMQLVDALSPPWRALVHEYGFKAVMQCREEDKSLDEADDALWMARSARQASWLATNYITPRAARSYNV